MEIKHLENNSFPDSFYAISGTGKPVFFIHGFAEDHTIWNAVVREVCANYLCIIPFLPGCGHSALTSGEINMELLADFVYAILKQEHLESVAIFGHSMGGYISLALAEKHPRVFKLLSLVHSSAFADSPEKKQTRMDAVRHIQQHGKDAFIQLLIPKLYAEQTGHLENEKKRHREMAMQYSDEAIIKFYIAMANRRDQSKTLKDLHIPVQIITGDEDASLPLDQAIQQSQLSNVTKLDIFPQTGHTSYYEKPEALKKCIIDFLNDFYNI